MPRAWTIIPDRFVDGRHVAFEEGARAAGYVIENGRGRAAIEGRPGDILMTWNLHGYKGRLAQAFEAGGGQVVVCEEGYTRKLWAPTHFAVSLHGHNGSGQWYPKGSARWAATGLQAKPWRVDGDHVLVCGQRGIGNDLMRSPPDWHEKAARQLAGITNRPIRVRPHPGKEKKRSPPLADDLVGAWAVVVWSSACAVHALMEGIPCIYQAPHHIVASAMGRRLEMVNHVPLTNREDAFVSMAWAQWTMDEVRAGRPFQHLCPIQ